MIHESRKTFASIPFILISTFEHDRVVCTVLGGRLSHFEVNLVLTFSMLSNGLFLLKGFISA